MFRSLPPQWVAAHHAGVAGQVFAGQLALLAAHGAGKETENVDAGHQVILAGQVQGFGLVTADGEHLDCNATENAEVFQLGRVGLGCLGILTYVDMTIVPAFQLRAVEQGCCTNHPDAA